MGEGVAVGGDDHAAPVALLGPGGSGGADVVGLEPGGGDRQQPERVEQGGTALELVDSNLSELTFREAPGIVGVVEKVGPPYRKFTFVDGMALPVLSNAKKLLIADVL